MLVAGFLAFFCHTTFARFLASAEQEQTGYSIVSSSPCQVVKESLLFTTHSSYICGCCSGRAVFCDNSFELRSSLNGSSLMASTQPFDPLVSSFISPNDLFSKFGKYVSASSLFLRQAWLACLRFGSVLHNDDLVLIPRKLRIEYKKRSR